MPWSSCLPKDSLGSSWCLSSTRYKVSITLTLNCPAACRYGSCEICRPQVYITIISLSLLSETNQWTFGFEPLPSVRVSYSPSAPSNPKAGGRRARLAMECLRSPDTVSWRPLVFLSDPFTWASRDLCPCVYEPCRETLGAENKCKTLLNSKHLSADVLRSSGYTHLSEDMLAATCRCRSVATGSKLWDKIIFIPMPLSSLRWKWDIWASSFTLSFPSACTCTELLHFPDTAHRSAVAFTLMEQITGQLLDWTSSMTWIYSET